MDKLILEHFRCFDARQEVPLAPLTVLVGENSSGKSSFLAAVRIAWDIARGRGTANFNEDPFRLGAYEQIATYRGGKAGRAKSFTIGQQQKPTSLAGQDAKPVWVDGSFIQSGPQPYLSSLCIANEALRIEYDLSSEAQPRIKVTKGERTWTSPMSDTTADQLATRPFLLYELTYVTLRQHKISTHRRVSKKRTIYEFPSAVCVRTSAITATADL